MLDLTKQSARFLLNLIRRREVSPVEVLAAHISVIERLNPSLNAICTLSPVALAHAQAAETTIMRGDEVRPLTGLPVTIKDTIATGGLRTTSGTVTRSDFIPQKDAGAVARLRAAGAIILGKSNTAEMAMDYNADNPVFGRTNNPHDPSRTSGGSSGGEAVAIATGMSPCGLGSDLAGSIRIPAHFCGIVGFKPATGSVAGDGQHPAGIGPYSLGSTIGPMARSVEDIELLFSVLSASRNTRSEIALRDVRVAWYTDDKTAPVSEDTVKAVQLAADSLAQAGLLPSEILPPGIERSNELWLKMFSRASVVELREAYRDRVDEAGDFIRWRLSTAGSERVPSLDEYLATWRDRDRLREELIDWMSNFPILLAPVGSVPAFQHGMHRVSVGGKSIGTFRAFSYAQAFNVFDLPAISVPVSRSAEGLPLGIQVVSRPGDEARLFAVARVLEAASGGWQPPSLDR